MFRGFVVVLHTFSTFYGWIIELGWDSIKKIGRRHLGSTEIQGILLQFIEMSVKGILLQFIEMSVKLIKKNVLSFYCKVEIQ